MTSPDRARPRGVASVPAPALFVGSGLVQYVGAAIAVGLFAVVGPPELAWLRVAVAALVLLAWRRPWRLTWTRRALGAAAVFGCALAAMNVAFYVAIEHLPLGTAVAIEFAGPVAVAAFTGRRREIAGGLLAAVGVVALAGVTLSTQAEQGDVVVGLVAIGLAAAFWAAYIVLGQRVATGGAAAHGLSSLAVAMAAGALVFAPFLAWRAVPAMADWRTAGLVLAVAVLSSVIPYAVEQIVLRRVTAATFAVLLALLPVTAVVVGAVWLRQVPGVWEVAGIACVCAAIAITGTGRARRAVRLGGRAGRADPRALPPQ